MADEIIYEVKRVPFKWILKKTSKSYAITFTSKPLSYRAKYPLFLTVKDVLQAEEYPVNKLLEVSSLNKHNSNKPLISLSKQIKKLIIDLGDAHLVNSSIN